MDFQKKIVLNVNQIFLYFNLNVFWNVKNNIFMTDKKLIVKNVLIFAYNVMAI
jgi:hypothetical protein